MASSFRKIDYRLRPAKGVERRMMAEAFLRLRPFAAVETYRYVGMGSVYFSDFALFHSICGFETMVSIDETQDPIIQKRFEFNAPLGNIELQFKPSNTALPRLPWDLRSVVWMDYDGALTSNVMVDVRYLAAKVMSGSVLCVSVNGSLEDEEEGDASRVAVLKKRLGESEPLPDWVTKADAIKPGEVSRAIRDIFSQGVRDSINDRNAGRPAGQRFTAEQIFFFKYQDNAPMYTMGWLFFDEGQRETFAQCGFDRLLYYAAGEAPFEIEIPLITNAEVREINRCNDTVDGRRFKDLPVPPSEISKYNNVRRYWPTTSAPELT
jgi:hypothetical protein